MKIGGFKEVKKEAYPKNVKLAREGGVAMSVTHNPVTT